MSNKVQCVCGTIYPDSMGTCPRCSKPTRETQMQDDFRKHKPTCPECGAPVMMTEGCMKCPTCGWSACG